MNLELPVSLGEAIDKLTILDIKCDKIKDNRKIDVQKEYDMLYEKLKEFIEKYDALYASMKKINVLIWDQMDILRDDAITDDYYIKLCKECIESNDVRFRIKNKINLISNSELKEQKSYKVKRLIIELNCNEYYLSLFIDIIKYFSYIYDEIIIYSSKDIHVITDIFYYDNTIKYNNIGFFKENDVEFKDQFVFNRDIYTMNEIYEITNMNKEQLDLYN